MTEEITGIECGLCHEESFQLVPRKAYVTLNVCTRCARKIDADLQEKSDEETLKGMEKAERLLKRKEMSHEWARSWHGKFVILTHYSYDSQTDDVKADGRIKGKAFYDSPHEDRGWGRLKAIIDESELYRIKKVKCDVNPANKILAIDGERYGLANHLLTHGYYFEYDKPLAIRINWGDRNELILEEFDQEKERLREEQKVKVLMNMAEATKY